jgi:hypothetical protein
MGANKRAEGQDREEGFVNFDEQVTRAVGENIDALVTLDMRGYGVPRLLYGPVRERVGAPLIMTAAQKLQATVSPGDVVLIATGFVFSPPKKGELDGIVGTAILARALEATLGVVPIIVVEEVLVSAATSLLRAAGLNACSTTEEAKSLKHAAAAIGFPTDVAAAAAAATGVLDILQPAAVLSIERPGRNDRGVYHMGNGQDVSELAAKIDEIIVQAQQRKIPTFAIGDLGNELGFGEFAEVVRERIPFGARCVCPCGGGIAAAVASDHLIVATTSDWGAYALAACLAHVTQQWKGLPDRPTLIRTLNAAVDAGLLDGSGYAIPAVDGINPDDNAAFVELLSAAVRHPNEAKVKYGAMYERTAALAQVRERSLT